MPKFLFEAMYTVEGAQGVRSQGGSSRREAIAKVAESVGGRLDAVIVTATDIALTIPSIIQLAVIAAFYSIGSDWGLAVLIGVLGWPGLLRAVRAQAFSIKEREYVEAARLLDLSTSRIVMKEIVPNMASYIMMNFVLGAINAILLALHPSWSLMMVPALLVLHRSVLLRQLEEAASTDQKTGLANATAWTNLASAEVRRAARDETRVGVLMVDLDHFKAVNDLHGHLVLQAGADTLTACAGRYDVVGRWGGEEFVVLCPEITREGLHATGERICERVRELRVPVSTEDGAEVVDGLSVSIGVALYPEFGPDLQDVLLAADDALFVAKDSGRNQVQTIVAAIGDLTQRPG